MYGNEEQQENQDMNYQQNMNYNQNMNNSSNTNNNKKKNNNKIIVVVIIAVVVLGFALLTVAGYAWLNKMKNGTEILDKQGNTTTEQEANDLEQTTYNNTKVYQKSEGIYVTDVSEIVEQNMPSVVSITSTTVMESGDYYDFYDFYFGGGGNKKYEQQAAGSGIIIKQTDKELLIVTNNHVVEDANSLKIKFDGMKDDSDAVDGYVKGTNSTADVAVVAVKKSDIPQSANIKVATLGDSGAVQVGDGVIAIGNALGYGQSVTTGIISAKDRKVELENGTMTLLQTDAAINGGNSGGALLNSSGEVIGINVAKYSSNGSSSSASVEGMGFAIPISSVTNIIGDLESMKTRQKVAEKDRGYLGISSGMDISAEDSEIFNAPQGVLISDVKDNSPADKAGIQKNDIITSFDGQKITSMKELQNKMEYYAAGEKVKIKFSRNSKSGGYKEKEVSVTLGDSSVLPR